MMKSSSVYKGVILVLLAILGILLGLLRRKSEPSRIENKQTGYVDLSSAASKVKNSVVGIVVIRHKRVGKGYYYDYFRNRFHERNGGNVFREVTNMGSGFVIDGSGYILTSYHVVDGASEMVVNFPSGGAYNATLIGLDSLSDLAVIKVEAKDKKLAPVSFANSDNTRVGEWVLAVGNPYLNFIKNADPTVTVGVVSALHRNFRRNSTSLYQNMIQTDAAINPGNSGGPLIDAEGRVIGVNAFIYTGGNNGDNSSGSIGLGFAIPSNRALHIAEELITYGRRRRVHYGMLLFQSNGGSGLEPGLYVHSLEKDGPADKAGFKLKDKVISIDRREIHTADDLNGILLPYFPGDTVKIRVKRNGVEENLDLILMNARH